MRVLVDAIGGTWGGNRTYTSNLLDAWASGFPDDDLHVVYRRGGPSPSTSRHLHLHGQRIPSPELVARPLVQSWAIPRLVRELGVDVVLATVPSTSLRDPGAPLAVVVHDLRHQLRPEQFTLVRRSVRSLSYGRTFRLADGVIAVSERTLQDLLRLHPRLHERRSVVVHHGADHVEPSTVDESAYAVAFGHHPNKRSDLAVEAWRSVTGLQLRVVGVPDADRGRLGAIIDRHDLRGRVELQPFLDDDTFDDVMAGASLVVLPSEFEGFGLPAVEAMRRGVPVVISPDPALREVCDGHATVMDAWTAASLSAAAHRALARSDADAAAAGAHAASFTWTRCAAETRAFLETIIGGRRPDEDDVVARG